MEEVGICVRGQCGARPCGTVVHESGDSVGTTRDISAEQCDGHGNTVDSQSFTDVSSDAPRLCMRPDVGATNGYSVARGM